MQYKNESYIFDIDIYSARVHVLHNLSEEKLQGYFKNNFPGSDYKRNKSFDAKAFCMEHDCGVVEYVIDFVKPLNKNKFDSYNLITHESFHIAFYILNDRNIQITEENQEPFSYLQGFLAGKIYSEIFKVK